MEVQMSGAEVFNYWWLIPLVLICLCVFGARGCCVGRGPRYRYFPGRNAEPDTISPLEILSRRYARGEIDDEEYQKKREAITQSSKGEMK